MMDENDWTELTLDETFNVTRSDYTDNDQQLEYYDQALNDDEVLVVYTGWRDIQYFGGANRYQIP